MRRSAIGGFRLPIAERPYAGHMLGPLEHGGCKTEMAISVGWIMSG